MKTRDEPVLKLHRDCVKVDIFGFEIILKKTENYVAVSYYRGIIAYKQMPNEDLCGRGYREVCEIEGLNKKDGVIVLKIEDGKAIEI